MKRSGRPGAAGRDPVRLEVFHHLFAAVAEEMGAALLRASFSPNIKERRDFSCALFDGDGRMISQAAHIPVHLGSAPLSVAAAIERLDLQRGDTAILNDPYAGGTHLPDITLVSPVFLTEAPEPDFYVANRAHHADVGGPEPGSMAPAADVHGEGLRIPPVKLIRAGEVDREVLALLLANMRVPREREADLLAQGAANRIAARRLAELAREQGREELVARGAQLMDWTESLLRAALSELPAREVQFEDVLETADGVAAIRLRLRRGRSGLVADFGATDDQVAGAVNAPRAVLLSAVFYVLRTLLPAGTPTNDGILRCVDVRSRPGSLVDARYPAAVAAGNVETSQRIVDVLLGALAQLDPARVPAASAGTMSNLSFGAARDGDRSWTYYETLAGGAGASADGPGAHALHTHMTNTRNTPVEAFENQLPVRVLSGTVRRGSGGKGARPGGDGIERRLLFLEPARASWIADRQRRGPWGLAGGGAGAPGGARHVPAKGEPRDLSGRESFTLAAGDELHVRTPGGGGHGRPRRARKGARGS